MVFLSLESWCSGFGEFDYDYDNIHSQKYEFAPHPHPSIKIYVQTIFLSFIKCKKSSEVFLLSFTAV